MKRIWRHIVRAEWLCTLVVFAVILSATFTSAGTFQWDENTESDLGGYRIYLQNVELYDIPPSDHLSVPSTPDGFYVITAYDVYGNESEPSNEILIAGYYYNSIRYDYETSIVKRLIYKGEHTQHDASVDDVNWVITKYYYNGDVVSHMRIRTTSWTLRAVGW